MAPNIPAWRISWTEEPGGYTPWGHNSASEHSGIASYKLEFCNIKKCRPISWQDSISFLISFKKSSSLDAKTFVLKKMDNISWVLINGVDFLLRILLIYVIIILSPIEAWLPFYRQGSCLYKLPGKRGDWEPCKKKSPVGLGLLQNLTSISPHATHPSYSLGDPGHTCMTLPFHTRPHVEVQVRKWCPWVLNRRL